MRKIKSGVIGLNPLLDGGLNEHSTTVVIGASGAGKTTFATQFIRRGLEMGHDGLFVSLDENQDQIIREAIEMGWKDIHEYINDGSLVFIDASGKKFSEFVRQELPSFVDSWSGSESRIAIDPLTPVIWASESRYEQRELLSILLKETRKIGTVLCTLEEHGTGGELSGDEIVIPMYLADCVIHLKYTRKGGVVARTLEIPKCRSSRHSDLSHPYRIIKGFGLVVLPYRLEDTTKKITPELRRPLEKTLVRLPLKVRARIASALDELTDADFKEIDIHQLLRDLIDDYTE
jgi:KaiC/GvpD/RAD55 family RecA-like ATPase